MRVIDRSNANRPRVMLAAAVVALAAAMLPSAARADLLVPTPVATHAVTTHVAAAPASSPVAAPQGGEPTPSPAPAASSGGGPAPTAGSGRNAPTRSGSAPTANGPGRPSRTPPTDSPYGYFDPNCDAGCHRAWQDHLQALYGDFKAQAALLHGMEPAISTLEANFQPLFVGLENLMDIIENDKASLGTLYENLTNPVWSPGYTGGSDIGADCSMVMQPLTMANWIAEDGGGASGAC